MPTNAEANNQTAAGTGTGLPSAVIVIWPPLIPVAPNFQMISVSSNEPLRLFKMPEPLKSSAVNDPAPDVSIVVIPVPRSSTI